MLSPFSRAAQTAFASDNEPGRNDQERGERVTPSAAAKNSRTDNCLRLHESF
jgi:hypothetical protein